MRLVSKRKFGGLIAGLIMTLAMPAAALASLSQGFASTTPIPAGSLVSLDEKSSGSVVVADLNNSTRLFGVAVPPSSASISLSGSGDGQVQVATNGSVTVFVTTAGGEIKVGDYIAVSQIAGVGQKAAGKVRVIGTAQADFNGSGDGTTKQTIDVNGVKTEVVVGQIPVEVAVSNFSSDSTNSFAVPTWLQSLSNTIAGKTVSPIRVLVAGLILLTAIISITVLLYSAVRNSIISIGRNPLSRSSVLKGLFQVLIIVGVILAASVGAIYLVITR